MAKKNHDDGSERDVVDAAKTGARGAKALAGSVAAVVLTAAAEVFEATAATKRPL